MNAISDSLAFWLAVSGLWTVFAFSAAADRGWLDGVIDSRVMAFLDRWIGPIWRFVYRRTGAEALDRRLAPLLDRISSKRRHRDALRWAGLSANLEAAGLHDAAETAADAAAHLAIGD